MLFIDSFDTPASQYISFSYVARKKNLYRFISFLQFTILVRDKPFCFDGKQCLKI